MLILQATAKTDTEREGGRAKREMLILQTTAKTDRERWGGGGGGGGRKGEERISK